MKRAPFACVREDGTPKKNYKTREIAERDAKLLERRVLYAISVYPCHNGHGFHIGHHPTRLSERVRTCSPVFKTG